MISIDIFDTALLSDTYDFFSTRRSEEELLKHCTANEEILKVYSLYKSNFVFISDDGYDENFLRELLYKCGYDYPKVIVPSSKDVKKIDGSFYREIEEKLGEKIVTHYGDNYEEDIEGAIKNGINAVYNPPIQELNMSLPDVNDLKFKQYIATLFAYSFEDNVYTKPIRVLGALLAPVILEFSKVIKEEDNMVIGSKSLFCMQKVLEKTFITSVKYKDIEADDTRVEESSTLVTFYQKKGQAKNKFLFGPRGFLNAENMDIFKFFLSFDSDTKMYSKAGDKPKKVFYSKALVEQIWESCEYLKDCSFSKEDLGTLLKFLRTNPYFYPLYNDLSLIRVEKAQRSFVNYNRELIRAGYLKDLFEASYDKEIFLDMLKRDEDYKNLVKLL